MEHELDTMLALDDQTGNAPSGGYWTPKPDVVVWDSLYSFAAGDLNKDQDMRAVPDPRSSNRMPPEPETGPASSFTTTTGKTGLAGIGIDRASFGRNSGAPFLGTRADQRCRAEPRRQQDACGSLCRMFQRSRFCPSPHAWTPLA